MAIINSNLHVSWATIKIFLDAKLLSSQWVDLDSNYYIFVYDGVFSISCVIPKTGSSDQTDFETNYKSNGNKLLAFSSNGIFIDRSGTTSSTPNTSTQIAPINLSRKYIFIQNVDEATIWINFTSAATIGQPSIELTGGSSFVLEGTSISTEAINVISASTSVPYTVKEK